VGCDIHTFVEVRKNGVWNEAHIEMPDYSWGEPRTTTQPFSNRSYAMFGILADVRNYSGIMPIKERCGIPDDVSFSFNAEHGCLRYDGHSPTYYTLKELLDFDWDQPCEDRRVTREISPGCYDGGVTAKPGEGEMKTYRGMLCEVFFSQIEAMRESTENPEDLRIVMFFDN